MFVEKAGVTGQTCLIFPNEESAKECVEFATSPKRGDQKLAREDLIIRVFDAQQRFWTVFFALENVPKVIMFWINPGVGISTRLAEETLKHIDNLREITYEEAKSSRLSDEEDAIHGHLRRRILQYAYRAPIDPSRKQADSSDVYLFQTGMSAIYSLHKYLLREYNQTSVLYSFPFHSTYHIFDDFGPSLKFYGNADTNDLESLTTWLESHYASGNKIQALWCEFPSNPLAITPDLQSLRRLADQYSFFLIVDDTIGSFSNVDLSSVADVILTSLTKSFSGYADVMGGSIILNRSLPSYPTLKKLFTAHYQNALYKSDAQVLLSNSADYISRSAIHNRNALALTSYFSALAKDPNSCIAKVYYPSVSPSLSLYKPFMRPTTPEFTPGYGALLSIEFKTLAQTAIFYDNLNLFKAPHLGAHVTLVLPYVKGLYSSELEWVGQYDLRETQVRIAPGLEDEEELLGRFRDAIEAVKRSEMNGRVNGEVKGEDFVVGIS